MNTTWDYHWETQDTKAVSERLLKDIDAIGTGKEINFSKIEAMYLEQSVIETAQKELEDFRENKHNYKKYPKIEERDWVL